MERVIQSVAGLVLETGKLLGGLAVLEDAHHATAHVEAVGAAGLVHLSPTPTPRPRGTGTERRFSEGAKLAPLRWLWPHAWPQIQRRSQIWLRI